MYNYPDLNDNNIPDIFETFNAQDYNYFVPDVDNTGVEPFTSPENDLVLLENTATSDVADKLNYTNYMLYKSSTYLSISVCLTCVMFGILLIERIFKK